MRRRRSKSALKALNHRLLVGLLVFLLVGTVTINCTKTDRQAVASDGEFSLDSAGSKAEEPLVLALDSEQQQVLSAGEMWADVSDTISSPRPSYRSTATISLNVVDADLLDVLTTLAYKLDVNIIYLEEPIKLTVKTENLTPLDTLQVILQKHSLDYIQVGSNYIVGQSSRLQSDFANRLILTRFNLKYVTADAMQGYLTSLGVPLNSITVDSNKYALWAKGTPMAIGEARELINALDIKENESITEGESFFIKYNLSYVVAAEMKRYLEEIGVPVLILTVDGNQKAIWMQGVTPALNEARDLIKALDIEENQSITAGDPYLAKFELEFVPADVMKRYLGELGVPVKSLTVESNQNTIWLHGIPYALSEAREMIRALDIKENESLAEGDAYFVRISLVYVQAEAMAGYLSSLNIPVDSILTIEANPQAIWLQGTPIAINKAREMINALDIRENASITEGEEFFIRIDLAYVSANAMKAYLIELDVPVQSILVVDSNQKTIWAQGTSRAINKANELIKALDILENQSLIEGEPTLARFNLSYVSAEDMAGHLGELGVQVTSITVDSNQKTIWIQGTPGAIARAGELIMNLDLPENASLPDESQYLSPQALSYVSADDMYAYLIDLEIPAESLLVVESNQKKIWVRGTPKVIADAIGFIERLDIKENASFAVGGSRLIRMPVATARGSDAAAELGNLIDLLSVLLDGIRAGDTTYWGTWDHPLPVPSISMQWDDPIFSYNEVRFKVSPNYGNAELPIHYLIAEGTPDNIEIINQMIEAITNTPDSPFSALYTEEEEEETSEPLTAPAGGATYNQSAYNTPPQYYTISAEAVPEEAGTISGAKPYVEGTLATISVTTAEGYTFVRWIEAGAEVSTSQTYSFTVYRDRFLEAVFISTEPESDQ